MSSSFSTSNDHPNPQLTSNECTRALSSFIRNETLLSVAAEASSHPSGVSSLYAQPYVYSGGGLGNINECHSFYPTTQTCLAGGTSRDSITFAAVCLPVECTALDLASRDFTASLELVSQGVYNATTASAELAHEYLTLHQRIAHVNKFLKTGWTCGELQIPWSVWMSGMYGLVVMMAMLCALFGTCILPRRRQRQEQQRQQQQRQDAHNHTHQEEKKESNTPALSYTQQPETPPSSPFWSAWNIHNHLDALCQQRPDTAALDGLRFGSILWVMFGHVLAIQSSSGGGYNNAADFLPPTGFTTTWKGQLLFASRFAVDTFLLISGYLVVHVLSKVTKQRVTSICKTYCRTIPKLLLHRLLRILPMYAMTLGFYVLIAPHMGSGPFWYQWAGLLEPCRKYGWTNLLFINNFVPFDLPNTATCFYHSWYLALDMQLFLMAPLLVYAFLKSWSKGKKATASFLIISIFTTLYLGWIRKWSLNTFDGTAVARYDVEAYAKPHVRAQAYLVGMLLAMKHQSIMSSSLQRKHRTTWKHHLRMIVALSLLAVVTFGTVTGAYARRPCRYKEWPTKNDCGSIWGSQATLWYTGLSRIAWSVAVCIIVDLCLQQHGGLVGDFLSLKCWTPLSHLSFGAYLVHPIVIFIWQLGNTQKETFRFLEVGMNYIAVCVVSFGAALLLALFVEFPCAALVKSYISKRHLTQSSFVEQHQKYNDDVDSQHLLPKTSELVSPQHRYGSTSYQQDRTTT